MKSLHIENLSVCYEKQPVLQHLALELHDDEIVCLLGASGCGKTTLLKAIAGLIVPTQGKMLLNQRDLATIAVEKRKIGMIFQDYALFPHLTVAENIAFGLADYSARQKDGIVAEMAKLVKLSAFLQRYPHELSGGQQQRVAIARSLACKPELLLLDEPFSNIDSQVRYQLIDEIKAILKKQKVAAIFVTHSKEEAFVFADKIALMEQGGIVQFDRPERLYQYPQSRFAADFLGSSNYLPCRLQDAHTLVSVLGTFHSPRPLTLANGGAIEPEKPLFCLIRPQQLQLAQNAQANGTVSGRRFLGHTFEYQLQIGDERLLVHSRRAFALEEQVHVSCRELTFCLFH
ncbi:ABC transporter [Chelonobacter oris]|uniref:ABC transporter ATP-binding protein n=1 Tax=Chelonobacter oris TaxID=505317 RepID=UPI00244B7D00|nr:ABC transporter ATP-binding protein [Chelonobacter oris]MDH2999793.1 ABC transporter [Chelonobacter oris]